MNELASKNFLLLLAEVGNNFVELRVILLHSQQDVRFKPCPAAYVFQLGTSSTIRASAYFDLFLTWVIHIFDVDKYDLSILFYGLNQSQQLPINSHSPQNFAVCDMTHSGYLEHTSVDPHLIYYADFQSPSIPSISQDRIHLAFYNCVNMMAYCQEVNGEHFEDLK